MATHHWLAGLIIVVAAQPNAVITRDVEFAKGWVRAPAAREKPLLLDVYEPRSRGAPRPALILIHGGGFVGGDKADANVADLCRQLVHRGFVCVSMNYRMIPDQPAEATSGLMPPLDAGVADARAAAHWLYANATRYVIDPARISIGGSSAGAVIALTLAYSPGAAHMFRGVFSWSGTLEGREKIIDAGEPALFIVHGAADDAVDPEAAIALLRRAALVGVRHELHLCDGLGHTVPLDRRPGGTSLYDRLVRFLQTDTNSDRVSSKPCPR